MDWEAALKAIGGATAIGGLIDLAMYKAEKKKFQDWLETWWLRFTDVKWSNFSRAEAALAVQILDRWAGARLWSWKRWQFATAVAIAAYVLVILLIISRDLWLGFNFLAPFHYVSRRQFLLVVTLIFGFIAPSLVAFRCR